MLNININPPHEKIIWIDVLRVVAMLLVVVGHSTYISGHTVFGGYEFVNEYDRHNIVLSVSGMLVSFIYSFHMPLFMAVSGACYSLTFGRKPFRQVMKNKYKRLLVPYFWTALCLSIPVRIALGYYESSGNSPLNILAHHFMCPFAIHLWFLGALFLVFPLFHLVKHIYDKNKILFWITVIALSLAGHMFCSRLQEFLCIPSALKYLFFFSVGFYSIKYFMKINPISIPILAISIVLQFGAFLLYGHIIQPLGNSYWFWIILALWGSYNVTMFSMTLAKLNFLLNSRIYKHILKYNFQIYLFSDPFNYIVLMAVFSIGAIDYFGNPVHTFSVVMLRIISGIVFGILMAKFVENIHLKNRLKNFAK